MGVGLRTLQRLRWIADEGFLRSPGAVLEIGSQNLCELGGEASYLQGFIDYFRAAAGLEPKKARGLGALGDGGKMSHLLELCGFDYQAIDIFDDERVVLLDLNIHDLPSGMADHFDLVTNFGTTEHIINQERAFRAMHDACKIGGAIYHEVPLAGYYHHGYFLYTPMFFHHLALANDYEIVLEGYRLEGEGTPVMPEMAVNGYRPSTYTDGLIEVIFRKVSNAPFRLPLETGTALGVNARTWGGEIPYRTIQGTKDERRPNRAFPRTDAQEALAQVAQVREEVFALRKELKSFKSFFSPLKPLKRFFR